MTELALRRIFTKKGWEVTSVATIRAGLKALAPTHDCVILDIMLPDGSGEEILQRIRSENLPTKVAVCTGTSEPDKLQRIRELKPDALLKKPIELEEILRICDRKEGKTPDKSCD